MVDRFGLMKIIAAIGDQASVGTTTIAWSLAGIYSRARLRVLLIDDGRDGYLTDRADALPLRSEIFTEVLDGTRPASDLILLTRSVDVGVDIIPHRQDSTTFPDHVPESIRSTLSRHYDVVLWDGSTSLPYPTLDLIDRWVWVTAQDSVPATPTVDTVIVHNMVRSLTVLSPSSSIIIPWSNELSDSDHDLKAAEPESVATAALIRLTKELGHV